MRVVSLAKGNLLEDSGVEECDVLVGVSAYTPCGAPWLLGKVLVDFSLCGLECQSRAVLCNTRGDSLTRSVQSGLQIALGSSKDSGRFQYR